MTENFFIPPYIGELAGEVLEHTLRRYDEALSMLDGEDDEKMKELRTKLSEGIEKVRKELDNRR